MHRERWLCAPAQGGAAPIPRKYAWPCSSVVSLFFGIACLASTCGLGAADAPHGIYNPLHEYETRAVDDRFSKFLAAWDQGQTGAIDLSGDLPFLRSLLK